MGANRKPDPIKRRILDALDANGGRMKYHALLRAVFPEHHFPRAFERPTRGGPPGCSMALSAAISRHGFHMSWPEDRRAGVVHTTISKGSAQRGEGE